MLVFFRHFVCVFVFVVVFVIVIVFVFVFVSSYDPIGWAEWKPTTTVTSALTSCRWLWKVWVSERQGKWWSDLCPTKKCTCWAHVDCPTRLICNWIFICFLWQSYKKRAGKSKSARWALAARDSPPFPKVEFLLLEKKSIMLSNAVSRKDEKNYWFWFNIVHTLHSTRWLFVLAKDNRANLYDRDTLNL